MGDITCSVEDCEYRTETKGYCAAHYRRWRLGKDLTAPMRRRAVRVNDGVCSVENCGRPRSYSTLCQMHYSRLRRHGDVNRGHTRKACVIDGCMAPAQARRLCASHYQAAKYHGEFGKARCSVDGCATFARTKGLCGMHYARSLRGLDLTIVSRRSPGTGRYDPNGYVQIKMPDGTHKMEHRIVMELVLGRPLDPHENVHHINGIRDDNRPENLELWVKPQPNGQRVSDLVQWVVDHYREEVIHLLA